MRIKYKYGTKERLFEMFGDNYQLNAIEDNDCLLNSYFNDLITNNIDIVSKDIKKIPNKEDSYLITVDCEDNNTKITFTFFCKINEFNLDNVNLIKDCFLYNLIITGSNEPIYDKEYLADFNKKNKEKIVNYVTDLVEMSDDEDITESIDSSLYNYKVDGYDVDGFVQHSYNSLSSEAKKQYIESAKAEMDKKLIDKGVNPFSFDKNSENYKIYKNKIKNIAIEMFKLSSENCNESGDYPREIGHKFKVKKQYKLDKKRRKSVTTIHEGDESVVDSSTGESLNIGDVITVDGWNGEFQIRYSYSEKRPFLVPTIDTNMTYKIYLDTISNLQFTKIKSFSDTDGGFIR